jgi:hypothetical protein
MHRPPSGEPMLSTHAIAGTTTRENSNIWIVRLGVALLVMVLLVLILQHVPCLELLGGDLFGIESVDSVAAIFSSKRKGIFHGRVIVSLCSRAGKDPLYSTPLLSLAGEDTLSFLGRCRDDLSC